MSPSEQSSMGSGGLGFTAIVRSRFAFLLSVGFSEFEIDATTVGYRRGKIAIAVYFEKRSYEIGLEFCCEGENYPISALIRATDPAAEIQYRDWAATTEASLILGVERLSELLRRYGHRVIQDDQEFFKLLIAQRELAVKEYEIDVLVRQIRPKAEAAFREGRFREAANLYERILPRLSKVEQARLAAARKRT